DHIERWRCPFLCRPVGARILLRSWVQGLTPLAIYVRRLAAAKVLHGQCERNSRTIAIGDAGGGTKCLLRPCRDVAVAAADGGGVGKVVERGRRNWWTGLGPVGSRRRADADGGRADDWRGCR